VSPRLQNAGLVVLLLVVAGLIASAVMGVVGKPGPAAVAPRTPAGHVPEPLANRPKVEVLNASGRSGLAKEVTHYLRDRGFDVVYFGNAGPGVGKATRVVLRGTDSLAARSLADTLHIATIAKQPDPNAFLEATVVLGVGWTIPGVDTMLPGPRDTVPAARDSASRTAAPRPAPAPAAPRVRVPAPASHR
jgi:hypothetical protein